MAAACVRVQVGPGSVSPNPAVPVPDTCTAGGALTKGSHSCIPAAPKAHETLSLMLRGWKFHSLVLE